MAKETSKGHRTLLLLTSQRYQGGPSAPSKHLTSVSSRPPQLDVPKTDVLLLTAQGRPLCLGLRKKAWVETPIELSMPYKQLSIHILRSSRVTAVWDDGKVTEHGLMKNGTSSAWKGYMRASRKIEMVIKAFKDMSK